MIVPGDDGVVTIFSADLDVGQKLRDNKFLLVDAFLDEDDLMVFHKGTTYLNGVADIAELSCAIAANHESVRVVVLVLGLYAHDGYECTDCADNFLHFKCFDCRCKDTEKREKCKRKTCFSFISECMVSSVKEKIRNNLMFVMLKE